ncbi:hypothetical protein EDI_147300 [Entamoeba dispar SAW760]|uniref:Uncharacterized protein n=1 Tax=Entamoeba dispar (strain ATCC PRA-260 / SAW760) TaxID=370354 RepID=B0EC83_ENTDS|nr:uncharacterized protein EDI_147300 [Entamoeba dispar SAW760]EDR27864.1 hypothetical protein EDI_147300 [Entamoeba dispar SAW760]|eukprot:EDR27864.1 hypothetical protein EDI_147300 [Entamoeba dispar SAW760]
MQNGEHHKISNNLKKKYDHQEKIFSLWGFIISYIVSKGGIVTVKPPIRKKVIDKRNEMKLVSVEVEGHLWTEKIFREQTIALTDRLQNKGAVKRYLSKDVHDLFMNTLTQWCKIRGAQDGIIINTKKSKNPTTNTYRSRNEFIITINVNGIIYTITDIKAKYGKLLKDVLEYFNRSKCHKLVISLATLPYQLQNAITTFGLQEKIVQPNQTINSNSIDGYFELFDPNGNILIPNFKFFIPFNIEEMLQPLVFK